MSKLLEMGDSLYFINNFGMSLMIVVRVSAKFAFTENEIRLEREKFLKTG